MKFSKSQPGYEDPVLIRMSDVKPVDRAIKGYAEMAYRRGVHQAIVFALQIVEHNPDVDAEQLLRTMSGVAGEMRFSSKSYPLYLEELLHKVGKRIVR